MVMAEIGGHKAYHIPNHRKVVHHSINSEFVQNKPEIFQTTCRSNLNIKFERQSRCVGCSAQIHDQYILRVAPDLEWHAACLKCQECQQLLDDSCTCFVRDGKTYCKRDYARLFGTRCDNCEISFNKNDLVMRAKNKVYHIDCFQCSVCSHKLHPGDEFALNKDGKLLCKNNHDYLEESPDSGISIEKKINNYNYIVNSNSNHSNKSLGNNNNSSEMGSLSDSESECESHKSIRENAFGSTDGKPTRVRTVLNEKQLHTLRTCYNANTRPDALMKEQLVEMTGLSPRVIRVWFQNKRCKDKKKTVEMKLQMQQEKDSKRLLSCGELPMIASSPIRHESHAHEITAYRPPWKALSEFAVRANLNADEIQTPTFQQLLYQMHGYDGVKEEL